jgi:hypothetical protein
MQTIADLIAGIESDIRRDRAAIEGILDVAKSERRSHLTATEDQHCELLIDAITRNQEKLERARALKAEEDQQEKRLDTVTYAPNRAERAGMQKYEQVVRIGQEPHTYSRDKDPEGKGTAFLTDVIGAYRGNPGSNERLSRHMREYEVDNKGRQTRAAGDVTTGALPNLVIPSYLVSEYAAKPSAARPFCDNGMRHVDLPPEGMNVEIALGNTTATAALQTSELVAAGGGNFDVNPLEVPVKTAEAWQLVSRQAIDRGRVTEQVVIADMLDQVAALIDKTVITETTTGLHDASTRITYDSATPLVTELYPYILQGASKIEQTLLNRGRPTHVMMHPRRWYWMQSLLGTSWPTISQPGMPAQSYGVNFAAGYDQGIAGVLPCGLKVITDANVPVVGLGAAQSGGGQDFIFIVPQYEGLLLEEPNREMFIRAEAPAANQLGVMLVVYEYFAYSFARYGATAFQHINGTGTVAPTGF